MSLKILYSNTICHLKIENPKEGQSYGPSEAAALIKLVKSKEFKTCTGLIWTTATNGIFCSGGNLKYYKKQTKRLQGIQTNRQIALSLKMLAECQVPTVALVDGDCLGGGIELLTAFDFVLSTPRSFFGLWQRRIGLTFGWGGGARMEARIGPKKTIQYALRANSFSAFEAQMLGLIDQVVPQSQLEAEALRFILKSQALPQTPFLSIKKWISSNEKSIFEKLWFNKDHRHVLSHFD